MLQKTLGPFNLTIKLIPLENQNIQKKKYSAGKMTDDQNSKYEKAHINFIEAIAEQVDSGFL